VSRLQRSGVLIAACVTAATALAVAPAAGGTVHRKRHRPQPVHRPSPKRPATCAGADAPASSSSLNRLRSAVVCLVNQQRTRRGLPPLASAAQLDSSAQAWTSTMVLTGQFTHGPGDAFARRITAAGYVWQTAGENIAAGFSTPRSVVAGWMASTDHCRNILNPSFRDVGTGESDSRVGPYSSGTWTQDFGLRLGQPAPSHNQGPMNGCPY
jgi:uncharacterized protein YkwD